MLMGSAAFTTTRWQLNSKCKKTTAEKKDEENTPHVDVKASINNKK